MSIRNSILLAIIVMATGFGLIALWAYQDNQEMEELCKNPHPEMIELCKDFKGDYHE